MRPSRDLSQCARCQNAPRLAYHAYCQSCRNEARRMAWKQLPPGRKRELYDERKKSKT